MQLRHFFFKTQTHHLLPADIRSAIQIVTDPTGDAERFNIEVFPFIRPDGGCTLENLIPRPFQSILKLGNGRLRLIMLIKQRDTRVRCMFVLTQAVDCLVSCLFIPRRRDLNHDFTQGTGNTESRVRGKDRTGFCMCPECLEFIKRYGLSIICRSCSHQRIEAGIQPTLIVWPHIITEMRRSAYKSPIAERFSQMA